MTDIVQSYAIEQTSNPLIKKFVDDNLQALVAQSAAAVPPGKHLLIVPFINNDEGRLAAVYKFNDKISAIGVLEHTWDPGSNKYELGAVITPF